MQQRPSGLEAHPGVALTHHLLSLITHALQSCHLKAVTVSLGDIPYPRAAQNTHFTFQRVYSEVPLPNPPTYADAHTHTTAWARVHAQTYK